MANGHIAPLSPTGLPPLPTPAYRANRLIVAAL